MINILFLVIVVLTMSKITLKCLQVVIAVDIDATKTTMTEA